MRRRHLVPMILALAGGCATGASTRTEANAPEPEATTREDTPVLALSGAFVAAMSPAVTSFGAASDGRYAYVLGGYHGEPHAYSREGQSRTLTRVPLEGGGFEVLAELPHGLQGLAAVHVDGKVCAFGGSRAENRSDEPTVMISSDEASCFDVEARTWSRLPPLPEGRSSHEADVIGETVYVAGGWKLAGDPMKGVFHEDLLALDLSKREPSWRSIRAPFERRAVGVAALDGKLAVVGGITADGEVSRRVDFYDPTTGAFSRGPDYPEDAFGVSVTRAGDAIVASGMDGRVYRLASPTGAWEEVGALAFPRFFHQLVAASEGSVLALGGISGMHTHGRARVVERVDLGVGGVTLGVVEIAWPGEAKNRQGVFVRGEHVFLFGGNVSLGQHDFEERHFTDEGLGLHLSSLTLTRLGAFPERRQTMATVVVGEEGLALGGFGHDGHAAVSHEEGFLYDFDSGRFTAGPSLPRSRTQFGLAEHEGALYVFGGLNYDPARGEDAFEHPTSILRAPDSSGRFVELGAELPGPRRAFAGAVHRGRYYLVGGMKEGFQLVDDCLAFDFESETFRPIACPSARLSGELVSIGDRLFLVGGSTVSGEAMTASRAIEMYDPERDTWETVVRELPFETRHARAFAMGRRIVLLSTHFEDARLRLAVIDVSRLVDAP